MYIGKRREPVTEGEIGEADAPVSIPENYHGNAFSREEAEPPRASIIQDYPEEDTKCAPKALPIAVSHTAHGEKTLPFHLDKLFSSDALLILLAILLSGSEDGGEIAVILLLLLLF